MDNQFVPNTFTVPETYNANSFSFVPLSNKVVEQDYEAVMSSVQKLKGIFGKGSNWPSDGLTLAKNKEDMKVHEREFRQREAFAYSIFDVNKTKCLGTAYIDPSPSVEFESMVHFWIREDSSHLESELADTIKYWLEDAWPFKNVAYPGRDIAWSKWDALVHKATENSL
ncbi:hypothetical protein JQC92_18550 [Shewanella sp. 202IG2-18]|uniref:hypothetical protein n=1 Tax=Parashewanella hymeniacidonis TaxID=2807618 RepID=UPI0019616BBD|nr:hypothetical protein [Parashewanella hymeniacidonis]MBM7074009.1 hypothetical protein [Parashewanella hymeniacidonis]